MIGHSIDPQIPIGKSDVYFLVLTERPIDRRPIGVFRSTKTLCPKTFPFFLARYFRASNTVSCLAFSNDGGMLAVGERGHHPSVTVWSLETGTVLRELAGGHRFGVGCVAFTLSGGGLVTMGFKHDRMLRVRRERGGGGELYSCHAWP